MKNAKPTKSLSSFESASMKIAEMQQVIGGNVINACQERGPKPAYCHQLL